MQVRLGVILGTALTIFVGGITLLGLLFGSSVVLETAPPEALLITGFSRLFLQIAVTTVALMVVVGVLNLLFVHISRLYRGRGYALNRINSLVLIVTFILTLSAYMAGRAGIVDAQNISRLLLEDVQIAIESSMAGLLFFVLVYGAFRILNREVSFYRMLFVVTVLVVLIGSLPEIPGVTVITVFYRWLLEVPVSAGARGILLGIALATLLTGVRILIGQDRSYT